PITTVDKTIIDCAFTHVDDRQIRLAIFQALQRGMTTKKKLLQQAGNRPARVLKLVSRFVGEVEL
ncbi:MAG: hypothetical protein MUO62_08495, partial [Anaerolineales bacterium]|nr:hypothetical protein [Anaerolineales bacterium]